MQQQLNRLQIRLKKYSTIDSKQFSQNIRKQQYCSLQRQKQPSIKKIQTKNKKLKYSFLNDTSNVESQFVLPKLQKYSNTFKQDRDIQKITNSLTAIINPENYKQKIEKNEIIRINLTNSRYKVTQNVCNELNFNICYDKNQYGACQMSKWDFKWTDSAVSSDYITKLSKSQRINFFCGISSISRKNNLIVNLARMKKQFKQQYDFFPQTFQFPSQSAKLNKYYKDRSAKRLNNVFIVKPEASCQGRGIYLCNSLYDIECQSKCVVQNYICNPMLYEGLKFDLRVYALVTNSNPLSIFIYREGLVRLATQQYKYPDQSNFSDLCMHLTNYAINKNSPNYKFNKSVEDLKFGHKQSLAQFFKLFKSKGIDSHDIWTQIKTNIVKTLISVQPHLNHEYRIAQPKNQDCSVCYHVLGFDFMMDNNGKCFLLQVNQTPSYSTEAPIDYLIKSYLIKDTLNIVKNQRKQAMNSSKTSYKSQIRKKIRTEYQQKQYNQWQTINQKQKPYLGNYERIYPSKYEQTQRQYQKLLAFSKIAYSNLYQTQKNKKQTSKFYLKDTSKILKSKTLANRNRETSRLKTQKSLQKLQIKEQSRSFMENLILQQKRLSNLGQFSPSKLINSLKIPVSYIQSFIQKKKVLEKFLNQSNHETNTVYSINRVSQKSNQHSYQKDKMQRLYKNPLQNVVQQRQFYEKQVQTNSNQQTNANQ